LSASKGRDEVVPKLVREIACGILDDVDRASEERPRRYGKGDDPAPTLVMVRRLVSSDPHAET
jgi:hypothetical protein